MSSLKRTLRVLTGGNGQAVTLPSLLEHVIDALEQADDVEGALAEFLDMVGTLFGVEAIALFSLSDQVTARAEVLTALDVLRHGPVEASLPAELGARLRLQGKELVELSVKAGPFPAPADVFPALRTLTWGVAVAVTQRGQLDGVLVMASRRRPQVKGSLEEWLQDLGQRLGWCMAHVRLARSVPLPGLLRALDRALGGLALTDARGRVQFANAAFLDHVGRSRREIVGLPLDEILDGKATHELHRTPVLDGRGTVTHGLVLLAERRVEPETPSPEVAALRALPGRDVLLDRLQMSLQRSRRKPDHRAAVLVLDIDRFAVVIESLGHQAGSELLAKVAERLTSAVRGSDTVAWLGGDEFAILLDDIRDAADAVRVAVQVQERFGAPVQVSDGELFATLSIGIGLGGVEYGNARELLRDAGTALGRAKQTKSGSYLIFDRTMHQEAIRRLDLETSLRRAVERGEFHLAFQPIVDLETRRVEAFEALIRWQRPEGTRLLPGEFISIAEDTGLIVPLGQWVLNEACQAAAAWDRASPGGRGPAVNVNVSPLQLERDDVVDHVVQALRSSGLPAARLKLEITESCLMERVKQKVELLTRLRTMGVSCTVDDFGTGYSSLGLLTRLPVDTLKIDRSFVGRMTSGSPDGKVVRAVIDLAHSLGLQVTAEGIEHEAQRSELAVLDCDLGQGYLFARPLTAEEALGLVRAGGTVPRGPVAVA